MAGEKVGKLLLKVFGSRNERLVKAYMSIVTEANKFEEKVGALDDESLRAKTKEFKEALANGSRPAEILPEAFAVVPEAAR